MRTLAKTALYASLDRIRDSARSRTSTRTEHLLFDIESPARSALVRTLIDRRSGRDLLDYWLSEPNRTRDDVLKLIDDAIRHCT